jgi:hypothetical protein
MNVTFLQVSSLIYENTVLGEIPRRPSEILRFPNPFIITIYYNFILFIFYFFFFKKKKKKKFISTSTKNLKSFQPLEVLFYKTHKQMTSQKSHRKKTRITVLGALLQSLKSIPILRFLCIFLLHC